MQEVDIKNYSIEQLEALGYRTLKEIKISKLNLATIERLIQEKTQAPKVEAEIKDPA